MGLSGEHRLPACRSRQLAETGEMRVTVNCACTDVAGRAAGNYRLAACAPQNAQFAISTAANHQRLLTSYLEITVADAVLGVPSEVGWVGAWEYAAELKLRWL
jgi:hypothetical protein